jgi:hypothetical protein
MTNEMHLIQFASSVKAIQMKLAKAMYRVENVIVLIDVMTIELP